MLNHLSSHPFLDNLAGYPARSPPSNDGLQALGSTWERRCVAFPGETLSFFIVLKQGHTVAPLQLF